MRSRSRSRSRSVTTYSDASYERARGELSRSRSRSRSRSPSPVRHGGGMDERFRSRSPVPPPRRHSPSPALRRRSPSPAYRRGGGDRGGGGGGRTWDRGGPSVRRYNDGREAPKPNRCLGVFGLGLDTREEDLREIFGKYGQLEKVELVYDRESHRSRGFGFIYFERLDDAVEAKARLSGEEIDGHRPLRHQNEKKEKKERKSNGESEKLYERRTKRTKKEQEVQAEDYRRVWTSRSRSERIRRRPASTWELPMEGRDRLATTVRDTMRIVEAPAITTKEDVGVMTTREDVVVMTTREDVVVMTTKEVVIVVTNRPRLPVIVVARHLMKIVAMVPGTVARRLLAETAVRRLPVVEATTIVATATSS